MLYTELAENFFEIFEMFPLQKFARKTNRL